MRLLVDENMPRSLVVDIARLGFAVEDVRDLGLRGRPDAEVFAAATASDAMIVTRDRGFADSRDWPDGFTAGVIFVNLPDDTTASEVNRRVTQLLSRRRPESLLGGVTFVELRRALSRAVR